MKKRPMVMLLTLTMVLIMCSLINGTVYAADGAEIAVWEDWRTAAASFTFEDGKKNHITQVAPAFDAYGYNASFYLVPSWNPDWSGFQVLAGNGHEIGSHGKTHGTLTADELSGSKNTINDNITNNDCITIAYPNANPPTAADAITVLKQSYIAGRMMNNSGNEVMSKDGPADWYKVPAIMTGSVSSSPACNSTDAFTGIMQQAIDKKGWVVFASFDVSGDYSPTDLNAIKGALAWAKQNDSTIWITTFRNAVMYIKERKAATIKKTGSDGSSVTYKLSHTIADGVCRYDYPLSIRVSVPDGWKTVKVSQNNKEIGSDIKDGWIYFKAVPNGGDIVVKNTTSNPGGESGGGNPGGTSGSTGGGPAGQDAAFTVGACTYMVQNQEAIVTAPANKNAKSIVIPATVYSGGKTYPVTAIAPNAFKGMKKLTSITIGKYVKTIGKKAFYNCRKLKKVTFKTKKLTKKSVGANAFKGIYKKAVVKCPKSKKKAYKTFLMKKGMKKTMKFK